MYLNNHIANLHVIIKIKTKQNLTLPSTFIARKK